MSKRSAKRSKRGLKERLEDFDRLPLQVKSAMTRPGSLNARKSQSISAKRRSSFKRR